MTKIELSRSGGMLGKKLKATSTIDAEEADIKKAIGQAIPEKNPLLRDAFNYSISINDGAPQPVDFQKLKGSIKKEIEKLAEQLKV